MELGKEYFGPLWSFVASNEITDIDYNGKISFRMKIDKRL